MPRSTFFTRQSARFLFRINLRILDTLHRRNNNRAWRMLKSLAKKLVSYEKRSSNIHELVDGFGSIKQNISIFAVISLVPICLCISMPIAMWINLVDRYEPAKAAIGAIGLLVGVCAGVLGLYYCIERFKIGRAASATLNDPEVHEEYLRCVERAAAIREKNAAIDQIQNRERADRRNKWDIRDLQQEIKIYSMSLKNDPSSHSYKNAAANIRVAEARLQEALLKRNS